MNNKDLNKEGLFSNFRSYFKKITKIIFITFSPLLLAMVFLACLEVFYPGVTNTLAVHIYLMQVLAFVYVTIIFVYFVRKK